METSETSRTPAQPRTGVSPLWRALAIAALAGVVVLALLASKYAAAVRYERIADSGARAALRDRITSLEHDVSEAHGQITALRRQADITGGVIGAALAPDSRIIHLAPLGAAPNASATILESPISGRATLLLSGLPPPPAGQSYALWWIGRRGAAMRATIVQIDAQGGATASLTAPPADAHVAASEVTLQPVNDDKAPGGTIYFRGATDVR